MTQQLKLNNEDLRALRALDPDVEISVDGESATISTDIEVTAARAITDGIDIIWMRFKFPGQPFDVKIRRVQLL